MWKPTANARKTSTNGAPCGPNFKYKSTRKKKNPPTSNPSWHIAKRRREGACTSREEFVSIVGCLNALVLWAGSALWQPSIDFRFPYQNRTNQPNRSRFNSEVPLSERSLGG